MIETAAIAAALLAALSDGEDPVDLDDLLARAVLLDKPEIFVDVVKSYDNDEIIEIFRGLARWVNETHSLDEMMPRSDLFMTFWQVLRKIHTGVYAHAVKSSTIRTLEISDVIELPYWDFIEAVDVRRGNDHFSKNPQAVKIRSFGGAIPYFVSQTDWLDGAWKKALRETMSEFQQRGEAVKVFNITEEGFLFSWDETRVLVLFPGQEIGVAVQHIPGKTAETLRRFKGKLLPRAFDPNDSHPVVTPCTWDL